MVINLKTITNKFNIKILSFILAYTVWSFFCFREVVEINVGIPVCFYDVDDAYDIECCEKITVSLKGRRNDLALLDYQTLALHVDASLLNTGPNYVYPTEKNLFLPPTIQIIGAKPNNLVASLTKKSK